MPRTTVSDTAIGPGSVAVPGARAGLGAAARALGELAGGDLLAHSMYFGAVAAAVGFADGRLRAVADPSRSGAIATGGVS